MRKMKATINFAKTNEYRRDIFWNLTTPIFTIKTAGKFCLTFTWFICYYKEVG